MLWLLRSHFLFLSIGLRTRGNRDIFQRQDRKSSALAIAATRGSPFAAVALGQGLADGLYGLQQNKKEAAYWLRKAIAAGGSVGSSAKSKFTQMMGTQTEA